MDVKADEGLIEDWLTKKGLRVERFSKAEMRGSKTPEFRVFKGRELAFFCEVKSLAKDESLDEKLAAAPPGTVVQVGGSDSTFNAVANKIHEAGAQFDAVNPDLTYANVLVLVNDKPACDVRDLRAVLEGCFVADDGTRHPIYTKYSEGRIRKEKLRIAVYIWVQRQTREACAKWYGRVRGRYPLLAEIFPVGCERIA